MVGKTPSPPGQGATAYACSDRQVEQDVVDKVATKLGSSLSTQGA